VFFYLALPEIRYPFGFVASLTEICLFLEFLFLYGFWAVLGFLSCCQFYW